jgi:hypothetical protein
VPKAVTRKYTSSGPGVDISEEYFIRKCRR